MTDITLLAESIKDGVRELVEENARLRAANEKLQEELEAAACQLGAQDAELIRLRAKGKGR